MTDHETWIMDLEKANKHGVPEWYKLYSAKEAYNMTALTPQDWHEFFQRLRKDDDLMDLYYKWVGILGFVSTPPPASQPLWKLT